MEIAYKYRIYPDKKQEELLAKTFGCVRYVYNHFLDTKIKLYEEEGKSLSFAQCSKILTEMKNSEETLWLKEPDKCALQNALKDLDRAYQNFFKHGSGFPKFKSKKTHRFSYRTQNNISKTGKGSIEFGHNKIKLPKLGWVRCRDKQIPFGKIVNATISQTPSGKYFCSLLVSEDFNKVIPETGAEVGIDVGIKEFCVLSNGQYVANPKYLDKALQKLAFLQRGLSRKTKGGSNWQKQRIKVARQYEKVANQRRDFLQKLTTDLIRSYGTICVEDLNVKGMLKNKSLSRQISDVSWCEFSRMLEYKAKWTDRKVIKVDRFFASSQTCHCCGYQNKDVKDLSVRQWTCPNCGASHDRDVNAAINILQKGKSVISLI